MQNAVNMLSFKCIVLLIISISLHLVLAHSTNNKTNSKRTGENLSKKKRGILSEDYDGSVPDGFEYNTALEAEKKYYEIGKRHKNHAIPLTGRGDAYFENQKSHKNGASKFIEAKKEYFKNKKSHTNGAFEFVEAEKDYFENKKSHTNGAFEFVEAEKDYFENKKSHTNGAFEFVEAEKDYFENKKSHTNGAFEFVEAEKDYFENKKSHTNGAFEFVEAEKDYFENKKSHTNGAFEFVEAEKDYFENKKSHTNGAFEFVEAEKDYFENKKSHTNGAFEFVEAEKDYFENKKSHTNGAFEFVEAEKEYFENKKSHTNSVLQLANHENGAFDFVEAEREIMTRPLQSGDTFTPMEMIPIAVKLLSKVDVIGAGKGIVTSSKSPEELADKMFGSYFLTSKRIVYLNDKDMSGLDAFQALALEGEAVEPARMGMDSITEPSNTFGYYKGQMIGLDTGPKKCHYKLLTKKQKLPVRVGKDKLTRRERVKLRLEKNMQKNRHLIVNPPKKQGRGRGMRSKIGLEKQKSLRQVQRGKGMKLKVNPSGKKVGVKRRRNQNETKYQLTTIKRKKGCKWRYICKHPGDLDSCRLHTSCIDDNDPKAKEDNIYLAHQEDEHNVEIQKFRKMLGITLLDENVEKIIEHHVLEIQPENMRGIDKIETLEEYFNNIIVAQHQRKTTPVDIHKAVFENVYNNHKKGHPMKGKDDSELERNEDSSESTDYADDEQAQAQRKGNETKTEIVQEPGRRMLVLPIISSTKPRKK